MPTWIWLTAIGFVLGSLPFSVWIGQAFLGKDIRTYGDANPGATNVLRAGGKWAALLAALLDSLKAAIPVGIAWIWLGISGWQMAVVAIAPIVGHAFSPFLRFRGGKAVATTFGTWCGLTVWEGPTILGLGLFMTTRRWRADGWVVLFSMIILLAWLLLTPPSWNGLGLRPPIPLILAVWIPNTALLIWKYRADFSHPPLLRSQPLPKP